MVQKKEMEERKVESANKQEEMDILSMLLFGAALVMWFLTLTEMKDNIELCREIHHIRGDFFPTVWHTVCVMWGTSIYFKLWVISAVASIALCWGGGGLLSVCMIVPSFCMPGAISFWHSDEMISVSLCTWMFIISLNIVVFMCWCISTSIKHSSEIKKEVSQQK